MVVLSPLGWCCFPSCNFSLLKKSEKLLYMSNVRQRSHDKFVRKQPQNTGQIERGWPDSVGQPCFEVPLFGPLSFWTHMRVVLRSSSLLLGGGGGFPPFPSSSLFWEHWLASPRVVGEKSSCFSPTEQEKKREKGVESIIC